MWDKDLFPEKEMQCKCGCGECDMDINFMGKLVLARKSANIPFIITSGYRCAHHDSMVSGSMNHSQGKAVDILVKNSRDRWIILHSLIVQGFCRFGFGKDFIHVDSCLDKPQDVVWLY